MTFAVSAPAFADDYGNPWCEIKHRVCENNPFYPSCIQAYQNCPNG
ncbi:hypothetical protein [Andreprevotia sp. IGB-42]|nr:hypothetical protein [Andreprevotia sp. IGB-42]